MGSYRYTISAISGVEGPQDGFWMLDNQGNGIFRLKHGQSITIQGRPEERFFLLAETVCRVQYKNVRKKSGDGLPDEIPKTGDGSGPAPYVCLLVFALGAMLMLTMKQTKKGR